MLVTTILAVPSGNSTSLTTLTVEVSSEVTAITTAITVQKVPFTTILLFAAVSPTSPAIASSASLGEAIGLSSSSSAFLSVSSNSSESITLATTAQSSSSKGLPAAATAGIGIGCAVAGALIALIACCIFFRGSQKPPRTYSAAKVSSSESDYHGHTDIENLEGSQTTSTTALDEIPLDRTDDSQIKSQMQDLNELIHQHVENHYNARPFLGRQSELEAELMKCGYDEHSKPSAQSMMAILLAPKTRRIAIRQVIARVILKGVMLESEEKTSLLPIYVLAACQAMMSVNRPAGEERATFTKSFNRWRRLTSFLISHPSSAHQSDPALQSAIMANVTLLKGVLRPFINPDAESQHHQSENLSSIVAEGAIFGMVIFSQPNAWRFSWDVANMSGTGVARGEARLVVWPGLGEVVFRGGRENLRMLCGAVVEQV